MLATRCTLGAPRQAFSGAAVPARQAAKVTRRVALAAKKGDDKEALDGRGFIVKDNSGRQNIFPTSSKAYLSSPTADAVASSGLGGLQGAGVVAAALAIVVIATVGVIGKENTGDTLAQVTNSYNGDSLSAVSARIAATL